MSAEENPIVTNLRTELEKLEPSRRRRVIEKVFMATLGSIPWIGVFLSAAATFNGIATG